MNASLDKAFAMFLAVRFVAGDPFLKAGNRGSFETQHCGARSAQGFRVLLAMVRGELPERTDFGARQARGFMYLRCRVAQCPKKPVGRLASLKRARDQDRRFKRGGGGAVGFRQITGGARNIWTAGGIEECAQRVFVVTGQKGFECGQVHWAGSVLSVYE